jgi:LysR family transcriptional regulator, transcriptional activator of the cysJI operon
MDTRQLAAFCAVIEKKSFSQAAERLGVTQPAVSLQIRALEKRLGVQLVDRSGRRVEPTEAGQRLYRNAQRVLAAEELLLDELTEGERIAGRFELGASTGPGGSVVPILLGELAATYPDLSVALTVADTHRIIELVADRAVELGVVGFARRHRSVVFEPLFRDQVVLACPPGHRFAGKTISLDDLREETLILMQEGAGVREAIEDELRAVGVRPRDFDARLELGLQESVRTAVEAGVGVTFISRSAIEAALAAGTLTEAHVKGLEPSRDIFLARAAGRTLTRAAQAFLDLARERLA